MDLIKKLFDIYKINLTASQVEIFGKLLKLFMEKNSKVNLSAIRDEEGIVEKHFIDSIMLNKEIKLHGKVLDIGTGGGFPGIPLSIINPDVDFTLVDATRKKIDAVNGFIDELGINNARGIWGRAEELSKNEDFAKKFDFVVSRATAYLPQILSWSSPFVKKGGMMIFYKQKNDDEITDGKNALLPYRFNNFKIKEYHIQDQDRIFIFIS